MLAHSALRTLRHGSLRFSNCASSAPDIYAARATLLPIMPTIMIRRNANSAAHASVTVKPEEPSFASPPNARPARTSRARVVSMAEQPDDGDSDRASGASSSSLSDVDDIVESPAPKKRGRKSNGSVNGKPKPVKMEEIDTNAIAHTPKKATPRKRTKAVQAEEDDFQASEAEDGPANKNGTPAKKTRKKKEKGPIVYEIPPIEQHRDFSQEGPEEKRAERANGFRGRLGYACLNTVLRNEDPPKFCSRNVRIKTIEEKGLDYVKDLAKQNARDIIPLLEWNAANNIHLMRLSSEIFPFASHEKYGYDISYAAEELAEAGAAAKRLNQRLTMHPGQFCQLGTPKESVLAASIRELEVHAKVLDLMGVGPDGVMILHGGGTFGDREATLKRIRETIETRLPDFVRRRLVLENDELGYSAEELLPLCESLDPPVPLIFDFHHDLLRPSSMPVAEIIERCEKLYRSRGIKPKYHLSEPRPGAKNSRERRAHSDRCGVLPDDLPADADLMLECKDKEQGVLHMYRIYKLFDVKHDSLRPPAEDSTMATAGKRSKLDGSGGSTKKAAKASASSGSDSEASDGGSKKKSPKKVRVTERSLIERAIERGKAVAAKRGVPYTGPKSQTDLDAERSAQVIASTEEVRVDMLRKAEWLRRELRLGNERRPFPGDEEEAASMEGKIANVPAPPEPEAY